jgi:ribosomal-protein-alanine N-acetyltransferase
MSTAADTATYVRVVTARDRRAFLTMTRASQALHQPWITPPTTERAFAHYLARTKKDDHAGFLVLRTQDDGLAGVVNINGIQRGTFQSASLGYYAAIDSTGAGHMTRGLALVVRQAFSTLGLHRLEANIQPGNERSIALARRCGFVLEGTSRRFLFVDGAWRDHERWAIWDERDTLDALSHDPS